MSTLNGPLVTPILTVAHTGDRQVEEDVSLNKGLMHTSICSPSFLAIGS